MQQVGRDDLRMQAEADAHGDAAGDDRQGGDIDAHDQKGQKEPGDDQRIAGEGADDLIDRRLDPRPRQRRLGQKAANNAAEPEEENERGHGH